MGKESSTVNISFRRDLLREIDDVAKTESRSRSELIREAARMYIERRRRWDEIFRQGEIAAENAGVTEEDVKKEIYAHRAGKTANE